MKFLSANGLFFAWKLFVPLDLMGCMLFVFGALGEAVVTGVLARNEKHLALARRIDLMARFVYPVIYAIVMSVTFL